MDEQKFREIETLLVSLEAKHEIMGETIQKLRDSIAMRHQHDLPMDGKYSRQVIGSPGRYHKVIFNGDGQPVIDEKISDNEARRLMDNGA